MYYCKCGGGGGAAAAATFVETNVFPLVHSSMNVGDDDGDDDDGKL